MGPEVTGEANPGPKGSPTHGTAVVEVARALRAADFFWASVVRLLSAARAPVVSLLRQGLEIVWCVGRGVKCEIWFNQRFVRANRTRIALSFSNIFKVANLHFQCRNTFAINAEQKEPQKTLPCDFSFSYARILQNRYKTSWRPLTNHQLNPHSLTSFWSANNSLRPSSRALFYFYYYNYFWRGGGGGRDKPKPRELARRQLIKNGENRGVCFFFANHDWNKSLLRTVHGNDFG